MISSQCIAQTVNFWLQQGRKKELCRYVIGLVMEDGFYGVTALNSCICGEIYRNCLLTWIV
jgi:hypothetical protein